MLVTPDFSRELLVQTDASEQGLGAVLSQVASGEEHPIMFLSKRLLPREHNYSTMEQQCLVVKWALESLKYYLLGRRITLITDHSPKETNAPITRLH